MSHSPAKCNLFCWGISFFTYITINLLNYNYNRNLFLLLYFLFLKFKYLVKSKYNYFIYKVTSQILYTLFRKNFLYSFQGNFILYISILYLKKQGSIFSLVFHCLISIIFMHFSFLILIYLQSLL